MNTSGLAPAPASSPRSCRDSVRAIIPASERVVVIPQPRRRFTPDRPRTGLGVFSGPITHNSQGQCLARNAARTGLGALTRRRRRATEPTAGLASRYLLSIEASRGEMKELQTEKPHE